MVELLFWSLLLLLLLLLLCKHHSLPSYVSVGLLKRQTEQEDLTFAALLLSDNKTDLTLSVLLSKHKRCAATAITMTTENTVAARIKDKILTVASGSSVPKIIAHSEGTEFQLIRTLYCV